MDGIFTLTNEGQPFFEWDYEQSDDDEPPGETDEKTCIVGFKAGGSVPSDIYDVYATQFLGNVFAGNSNLETIYLPRVQ